MRSREFEAVVEQQRCAELCSKKVEESRTEQDKNIWSFLKVNLSPSHSLTLSLIHYMLFLRPKATMYYIHVKCPFSIVVVIDSFIFFF